jgi:hypothetical protein
MIQRNKPINHIRAVIAGISGSSILDTEARTSGNGLSSSSIASKSNSILEGVGVVSSIVIGRGSRIEDIERNKKVHSDK